MDLYTLNSEMKPSRLIEDYTSLVWTERFFELGDFQMTIPATRHALLNLARGRFLGVSNSYRVMVINSVMRGQDKEGKDTLEVTGKSLEKVLTDRVVAYSMANTTDQPHWYLAGRPANLSRQIYNHICGVGALNGRDVLPDVVQNSKFFADSIVEPAEWLRMNLKRDTLYNVLSNLCHPYNISFRMYQHPETYKIHFDIYTGSDRTENQTQHTPVIFSPSMESLLNTRELDTDETYKNVAYVFAPMASRAVYAKGTSTQVSGYNRRVIPVEANDIDNPNFEQALEEITQRGREELSKHRKTYAFDGEVFDGSAFKHLRNYHLGDLVTLRTIENEPKTVRIVEQVTTSDESGVRSYPTFGDDLPTAMVNEAID